MGKSTSGVVVEILTKLLERRKKPVPTLRAESALFTDGLNLDSLEMTELAAMLDAEYGRDPFSDGELPETIGEIVRYYES